jgi:hypothetical protein
MPFAQRTQELIRWNKERVLLQDAPNNDHGVCPHDVDHNVSAKLGEIIQSYDRVFVARQ